VSAPSLVDELEAVDSFKILEAGFFGGTPYCHTGDKPLVINCYLIVGRMLKMNARPAF